MQFSITPLSEVLIIITSSKIIGIVENHSVSHSLPMSDAKVRVALKTEVRLGCKPFRTESSSNGFERIQPENLATVCHTLERHLATETKRLTANCAPSRKSDCCLSVAVIPHL